MKMKMRMKRGVSPVLATILMIGLAVAAGAMLFVVVIPLLQPQPKVQVMNVAYYKNTDLPVWNASKDAYIVQFEVHNMGVEEAQIETVDIQNKNGKSINFKLHTPEYLEQTLYQLDSFDFTISFVRLNPPNPIKVVVTLQSGKTYYSDLITL